MPGPTRALLHAEDASLGRPGLVEPLLEDVDLSLESGECVLLEGATGSGKSTLLRALAGLGGIELRGGAIHRGQPATLLLQDVETQLLCTTVAEEVALGLLHRGACAQSARARSEQALDRVGLSGYGPREVDALSAGEQQRVVLAALLALEPRVLLLDEPSSALDAPSRRALAGVLEELKAAGMALLIADHAPAELRALADRSVRLEGRRLHPTSLATAEAPWPTRDSRVAPTPDIRAAEPGRTERAEVPPRLAPGERLLLTGPNGSGKSTWLRRRVSEQERDRDQDRTQGRGRGRRRAGHRNQGLRPGEVALVGQSPRRSLFARTVAEEVGFSLSRQGRPAPECRARVAALLEGLDLLSLSDRSPLRASFGQQHRVAIAAALAAEPRIVLIDEPFAGLDPTARRHLLELLDEEQARSGSTLVLASHDREPLAGWCDRVIELPERSRRDDA